MNYLTKAIQYIKSLMGIFNVHYKGGLQYQNEINDTPGFKEDKANIKKDVSKYFTEEVINKAYAESLKKHPFKKITQ